MKGTPLVSIRCTVYNHEPFLRQCLDGFVMQQTTFPFEAIVHDDASTDGSAAIIREYAERYPDIIKPIYETENQFSKHDGSISRIMDAAIHPSAKYIAICEGDDYWIDPLKLQKQVDFLEKNPSYNMVYTKYIEDHNGTIKNGSWNLLDGNCIKPYLLREGFIPTASVVYRSDFKFNYDYRKMNFPLGDVPLWIQLMHDSPIKLLPDYTTTYRILDESASHSKKYINRVKFLIGALRCRKFFADKYGYTDISRILEKEIKTNSLILELYNGNYKSFISSKPWIYGLGLKGILGVLLNKHRDKNLK